MLHGGPHSVSLSSYSKSIAFLSSLGYNLLIVNYRYVKSFLSWGPLQKFIHWLLIFKLLLTCFCFVLLGIIWLCCPLWSFLQIMCYFSCRIVTVFLFVLHSKEHFFFIYLLLNLVWYYEGLVLIWVKRKEYL